MNRSHTHRSNRTPTPRPTARRPGHRGGNTLAVLTVAGVVAASLGWWMLRGCGSDRRDETKPPPISPNRDVRSVALVVDASPSSTGDVKARCVEAGAEIQRISALPGRLPIEVMILGTGDAARTGGAPQVLVGWARLERHPRPFVDPSVTEREYRAEVAAVAGLCAERIAVVGETRLFGAVSAALADLDTHCRALADDRVRCVDSSLQIFSDGQETSDKDIAGALAARVAGKTWRGAALPVLHSGVGARIRFCGLAHTTGGGGLLSGRVRNPSGIRETWAGILPGATIGDVCGEVSPLSPPIVRTESVAASPLHVHSEH